MNVANFNFLLFWMSSKNTPVKKGGQFTIKSSKKRRFIPSTPNWSSQGFTDSMKELVQFETSNGRISRPIVPRENENAIQGAINAVKNKSLILPCEVNVDCSPQPPCWSEFPTIEQDYTMPPAGDWNSRLAPFGHSSSAPAPAASVPTPQTAIVGVTQPFRSVGGASQPLTLQMLPKIQKRKVPVPSKVSSDDDGGSSGSDLADTDHRYQVDYHNPVTKVDYAYYRSCPDISQISPLLNHLAPPSTDNDEDYYVRTKTIPRLNKKITELEERDCREVLVMLNWDEARLMRRPYVDTGKRRLKQMKAPTAKEFLTTIIDILARMKKTMKSPELQRIDEAIFIRTTGMDNHICMPETRQVTGRAIETSLVYHNPINVFTNMLVDQLIPVKGSLNIKCSNRKVALLEKLIQEWVFGDEPIRKKVFEEVDRVLSYLRIVAPVTPEQRLVSSQVLYRVKGSNGKISDHLTFKVLLTALRTDLAVYVLCAALPRFRLKPSPSGKNHVITKHLSDSLPQDPPITLVNCPLNYPKSFKLFINGIEVTEPFRMERSDLMPLPVSQFCNLEGWNTFHISFDLTGQENRWETGMLVELVFATVTTRVTRHGEFPKYSVC